MQADSFLLKYQRCDHNQMALCILRCTQVIQFALRLISTFRDYYFCQIFVNNSLFLGIQGFFCFWPWFFCQQRLCCLSLQSTLEDSFSFADALLKLRQQLNCFWFFLLFLLHWVIKFLLLIGRHRLSLVSLPSHMYIFNDNNVSQPCKALASDGVWFNHIGHCPTYGVLSSTRVSIWKFCLLPIVCSLGCWLENELCSLFCEKSSRKRVLSWSAYFALLSFFIQNETNLFGLCAVLTSKTTLSRFCLQAHTGYSETFLCS